MVKRRRRFKQTTTLAQRLTQEAGRLREQARNVPPGLEQAELWRKIRQAETALRIDAWLTTPAVLPADDVMTLMGKRPKKRPAKLSHGSAS